VPVTAIAPRTLTGRGLRRATMPTPIYSIPIFTIEQARAVAGVLRGYLDMQAPSDNEPTPDLCDTIASDEFQGALAAWCHLDAFINSNTPKAADHAR
jgi:hypothetical protein